MKPIIQKRKSINSTLWAVLALVALALVLIVERAVRTWEERASRAAAVQSVPEPTEEDLVIPPTTPPPPRPGEVAEARSEPSPGGKLSIGLTWRPRLADQ